MLKFLKNIKVSLKAAGPFAVLCIYLICFTLVAIFALPENFESSLMIFALIGGFLAAIANNWLDINFALDQARLKIEQENRQEVDKNNE